MATKRKTLITKLDRIFSIYIRLRDRVSNDDSICATCGSIRAWNTLHNGHFASRKHKSTRWHEHNCSCQCPNCNTFNNGRQYEHGKSIDRRWGEGTADKMMRLSKDAVKWSTHELETMIDDYKARVGIELKKMSTSLNVKL